MGRAGRGGGRGAGGQHAGPDAGGKERELGSGCELGCWAGLGFPISWFSFLFSFFKPTQI